MKDRKNKNKRNKIRDKKTNNFHQSNKDNSKMQLKM